ncbi:MAG: NADH:ubiquinone reductase (Na(+)-transporting) subunit B [Flavobacteriales bacterium]|nr:NADH:ubiquinone reductase (Na(+)-transporting) subunit B [Flavobacteriales bacterium]|tara:strand:- start:10078 stop:11388 length:1311 start_codon:yes stop_codon:yes gene_type:complete
MKFLEKIVDKLEPNFEKGGKYEKWYPLFDGFATFLFTPKHTTKKGVHIRDAVDLKRTMNTVITAMIPCLLFGIWNTGYQHYSALGLTEEFGFLDQVFFGALKVLPVVIVSYVVGLGVEFGFCIAKGHPIEEGFLVSGMLIPLIVPADTPLWMVAVATIFSVVFVKEVFGGTGMNILNPALTARAFLFFAYPKQLSGDKAWVNTELPEGYSYAENGKYVLNEIGQRVGEVDAIAGATQLSRFKASVDVMKNTKDELGEAVGAAAQSFEAGVVKLSEKFDLWEAFVGIVPGSIGETSVIAILIGAGLLLHTGVGSLKIMLSGIFGAVFMTIIFNTAGVNPYMTVGPLEHLFAGGFMFGLVFMATDPVSAAQTEVGKVIYGFFIGLFCIMIRVFNPAYPEGMMLAILFMNVMAPLIDHYVIQGNIKQRLNRLKLNTANH